jgi:hypothetical protein
LIDLDFAVRCCSCFRRQNDCACIARDAEQNSKKKLGAGTMTSSLFGADFEFLCRSHTARFEDFDEFTHQVE